MIQIDQLTKEYSSGQRAVDGISLHVEAGEIFGFLGPNGAGKSTTIKILTTLLYPTSGTAIVAGYNVVEQPIRVRMSFGYVGQQSGVDPALTVRENLLLQGRLYHLPQPRIEERISFLLKLFDLTDMAGTWVGGLSGGMKRKLDIATALVHEPNLIFMDEPTLGLDPKSRTDLWSYITRLNQEQGITLFLTTHYLDEVDQLADRVGILDQGRIQAIGTPDQLKDSLGADSVHLTFPQPLSESFAAFFGQKESVKEVAHHGKELRIYLEDGKRALPKILQWVEEQGLSAETVTLARPTFDDVYLKYTGKSLLKENTKEKEDSSWGGWGKKWKESSNGNKWANKWNKGEGSKNRGREWPKKEMGEEPKAPAPAGPEKGEAEKARHQEDPNAGSQGGEQSWPQGGPKGWPQGEWKDSGWKDQGWNKK